MLPFQDSAFRLMSTWRPVEDAVSALIIHGATSRFPELKIAVIENGSEWLRPLLDRFKSVYKKAPHELAEDPVMVFKRNFYVSPFWEEDMGALAEVIGEDHVLFGSDYPHPEGLAEPADYVNDLSHLPEDTMRKIMGGNLARLLKVQLAS
jgi:predicted TIM-barrel fold metal-dependent hydrolase